MTPTSDLPIGAIAFGGSGVGCPVFAIETAHVILFQSRGPNVRVPLSAIKHWEMPTEAIEVGDPVLIHRIDGFWYQARVTKLPGGSGPTRCQFWKVRLEDGTETYCWYRRFLIKLSEEVRVAA